MRGRFSKFRLFNSITNNVMAGGVLAAGALFGAFYHDELRDEVRRTVEKTVGMLPESVSKWRERKLRETLFENEGLEYVANNIEGKKAILLRGENHYYVNEQGYHAIIQDILQNGRNPRVVRASNTGPFFRKLRGGYLVANVKNVESGDTVLPYYTSGVVSLSPDLGIAGMFSCGTNQLGIIIVTVPKEYSLPISRNARMNKYRASETDDESHELGHIIYNEHEYIMPRLHSDEVLAVCLVDTYNPGQRVLRVHLNEHVMQNLDKNIVLDEQALDFINMRLHDCKDPGAKELVSYFAGQTKNPDISLNKMYNAMAASNVAEAYSRALLDMRQVYKAKIAKRKPGEIFDFIMSPELDGVVYSSTSKKESFDEFILNKMPTFLRVLNQTYSLANRRTRLEYNEKVVHALAATIDSKSYLKIHPMLIDISLNDLLLLQHEMQEMGISEKVIDKLLGESLELYRRIHHDYGHEIRQAEHFLMDHAHQLDELKKSEQSQAAGVTKLKQ